MEAVIIKPTSDALKPYVQYFLFLEKTDDCKVNYTTFPNNNLCLAIYRQNKVLYTRQAGMNNCEVSAGAQTFVSRVYGFHLMPFCVNVHSQLDQICILFHPSGLRAFTQESYQELLLAENVFEDIFPVGSRFILERVFEKADPQDRAALLENLLLQQLAGAPPLKLREALYRIEWNRPDDHLRIENLCRQLCISDTSLYRLFTRHVGQSPQSFLKTHRFRRTLKDVLRQNSSLTSVGYEHDYFDQPHFIKDFKTFTGCSPKRLLKEISVQQQDLAWIYRPWK